MAFTSPKAKSTFLAGLFGFAAISTFSSPAHAATEVCNNPAFPGTFTIAILDSTPDAICTVGDKTLSSISILTNGTPFSAGTFMFQEPATGVHELSFTTSNPNQFVPGPAYTFSYIISATGTDLIRGQSTDLSSSVQLPTPSGTHKLTTLPGAVTMNSLGGPSPISFFTPVGALDANEEIKVTAGTITGFKTAYYQTSFKTGEVPGPLPLLGAASAFGFSRKLRRRIKSQLA
jgi:hypothetical protein